MMCSRHAVCCGQTDSWGGGRADVKISADPYVHVLFYEHGDGCPKLMLVLRFGQVQSKGAVQFVGMYIPLLLADHRREQFPDLDLFVTSTVV